MRKQDDLQSAIQPVGDEMDKKRYHKPVLSQYEDLRTVTLGNSPDGLESGGTTGIIPFKIAGTSPNPGAPNGSSPADDIFGGA